MLQLYTTDGFASWFGGLEDALAEEVAAGVELIERLGPERAPEQTSDLVLWFQCPPDPARSTLRFQRAMEDFTQFSARVRHILKHLESKAVLQKLAEAPGERAAQALAALQRSAERTPWRRLHAGDGPQMWEEVQALARRVYEAIGMDMPVDAPGTGLREWNLTSCKPGLRILYGVDAAQSRGLLISGEALDRSAYGPSVRRALGLWNAFLDGSLEQRISP